MTTVPYPIAHAAWAAPRERAASLFQRILLFLMGATLPIISLSTERDLSAAFIDRVKVVDVLCLLLVVVFFLARRFKLHGTLLVYYVALLISFAIGIAGQPTAATLREFFALAMASMYCIVGLSIANSPSLVRATMAGVAVGVLGEAVVVFHDFFFTPQWFLDRTVNRVRGTFSASGQLAQYGFASAGLLLGFGWACFEKRAWQILMLVSGGFACFFLIAAARRSGMFSLIIWLAFFLLFGLKLKFRRSYLLVAFLAVVGGIGFYVRSSTMADSYLGTRFLTAVESLGSGTSFSHKQFNLASKHLGEWFPLGIGVARGWSVVVPENEWEATEIHNGHLALLVEMGLLGLLAFYAIMYRPLLRTWDHAFGTASPVVRWVFTAYIIAATAFMIHNRLHRDRVFMLLAGMAPTLAAGAALNGRFGRGMPPLRAQQALAAGIRPGGP